MRIKFLNGTEKDFESLRGADLSGANLRRADLRGADLRYADLRLANLHGADLSLANLSGANLSGANLRGTELGGANLLSANLLGANLSGANLRRADLRGADLRYADLRCVDLGDDDVVKIVSTRTILVAGSLRVFKKLANEVICELEIPAEAKRVGGVTGRKCRAEFARVISGEGSSKHTSSFFYKAGEIVRPDKWDDNPLVECAAGIHFFITREEAEAH